MTAKEKALPVGDLPTRRATVETEGSPETQGGQAASPSGEQITGSASRFALLWFGIPLVLVISAVLVRMQCGATS